MDCVEDVIFLKTMSRDIRLWASEDGHNGARNIFSKWLINKSQFLHQVGLTNRFKLNSKSYAVFCNF